MLTIHFICKSINQKFLQYTSFVLTEPEGRK